ncbi:MAG: AzlD domain-containing protein [Pseudoruegeria sp.]
MTEIQNLIVALAISTFAIRLAGYALGDVMNRVPVLWRALSVFPGCLVVSLICVAIAEGGRDAMIAAIAAATVAIPSRNLVLTMVVGMGVMAWLQTH